MDFALDVRLNSLRELLYSVRLVPKENVRHQPAIVDILLYFISRLPPERLDHILLAQTALGHYAVPEIRLVALFRESPALHKLAQAFAHEHFLSPALREQLPALERMPTTADVTVLRQELKRQLRYVPGLEVGRRPIAEGSVAVIIPFEWSDGAGSKSTGVFKVLKPQAVEWMQQELAVWPDLCAFFADRLAQEGLPVADYRETLEGIGALLACEIDLEREQQNLAWAQLFYAGSPEVAIPRLLPFSTPDVTATERLDGLQKIADPALPQRTREALVKAAVKALIATPFWHVAEPGARLHGDPHAGNVMTSADGKLVVVDWTQLVKLSESQVAAIVRALLAALSFNEAVLLAAIEDLGTIDDPAALQTIVAGGLTAVRRGTAPGIVWLSDLLDRAGRAGAMHFAPEIALFRKSMRSLSQLLGDVCAESDADAVLLRSGAREFLRELKKRPDDGRRNGVPGAGLARAWTVLPFFSSRVFLDTWQELLRERERVSQAATAGA